MVTVPFALYDSFSDTAFGGSQVGVVSDAAALDAYARERIAREFGVPAMAYVTASRDRAIEARFRSTVMELPMCGHGTIALMARMVEPGVLTCAATAPSHQKRHLATISHEPLNLRIQVSGRTVQRRSESPYAGPTFE